MATIRDLAKKVRDDAKKNRESPENKARQERLSNATLSSNTAFTSAAKPQAELSKPAKITSDVSGEAWTRATPSQSKLKSGFTVSQQSEMNRLQEQRRKAQVDMDLDTVNAVDKRMKEIRAEAGNEFSAGKLATGIAEKGIQSAFRGLSKTAAMAEDIALKPLEWMTGDNTLSDKAPLNTIDRWAGGVQERTEKKYQQNITAGGKAAEVADKYGAMTIAALPQSLVAMLTGGTGAALQGTTKGLEVAATEATTKGTVATVRNVIGTLAKRYAGDKNFWTSFAQTTGDSYQQALADGASQGKAALEAIGSGLMNAAIEVGGGIQELPTEMQKGESAFRTWVDSMWDEGKEEVAQGVVERAMQNLVYGKGAPVFSTTDPNAVLNPRTAGEEFMGGAVVGGILSGGQMAIQSGVNAMVNAQNQGMAGGTGRVANAHVDAKNQTVYNETKVSPAASAQVQQTEAQAQVTQAENPDANVLDAATTLFTQQGMKLKTAQEKAGIVQKLIAGEEVSVRDINKLNPTSKESQAIFTQLTGVQFPEGKVTQEQLYNLYRSAHDVAVQAETVPINSTEGRETFPGVNRVLDEATAAQQTPTAQQYIAQHTGENDAQAVSRLAQMRGEIAPDGNALLSFKEFSDFVKQQNPKTTREATARLYDQYLKDNQTVEYRGQRLSHMQFMDMVRNAPTGSELTEAEAEDLWQREVKRQQDPNYNKEDSNGRGEDLVHSAGLSGVSDQSAGGQGSGVSEAAGRAEGDGGTRRGNQTGSRAGQSRDGRSEAAYRAGEKGYREIKIGDQSVTEVTSESYTPEMQTAVERFNGTSANVHVVLEGYPIPGTNSFADGVTIRQKDGRIDVYLQAASGLSLEGRADHELGHVAMFDNPEVKDQAIVALESAMTEQELQDLIGAYQAMYGSAYADSENLADDLLEEIVCDAYAGLNRANAGAPKYRSAVSAALDPQMQTYTAAYRESLALTDDSGNLVVESDDKGHSRFSLRTFKDSGREILDKWMHRAVVKGDLTQQDADDILSTIDTIYDVCEKYKDEYGPFSVWSDAKVVTDEKGNPVFSVVKANGDYSMNLDFSLVCKKRRTLDAVLNELVQRGFADNLALGQEDIVKINDVIREHGFETACALCFVDAKRFRQGKVADDFVKLYNDMVLSLIPENSGFEAQYFNFGGDSTITAVSNPIDQMPNSQLDFTHINEVLKTYGSKTVEHKVAKLLKNSAQDRKLTKRGDFLSTRGFDAINRQNPRVLKLFNAKKGSGGPKSAVSDVQYLNEVLKPNSFKQEKAYAVGGVRIQSFSDYVPRMVFDYVQMIADLSAKKLPAHAYTKEELFVKQFGLTGMKINMSLIPKVVDDGIAAGLDADGNYAWADESFDYDEALKIQSAEGYSRNCGTIAVGVSDEHIRALMADPDIRMVIPYHKSGLNPIVAKMNKIEAFTDYTDYQNTRHKDGTKLNPDNAADKRLLKEAPNFNQRLHELGENGDPRQVVEEYVKWCEDNDLLPKFDQFLYQQVDGVFVEQDGHKVIDPNYYKLIEDFTVYDGDSYVAQGPLSMSFPTEDSAFGSMAELIKRGLEEDAVLEGKRDSEVGAIVDEIIRGSRTTDAAMQDDSGMAFYDTEKKYSVLVEDKDTLDFLNNQKTIKTYKTMQLVDGKLYPPMASRINGKFEDASELGKWEQATEHPELIKNGNKFKLDKGKGNGSIEAAYNPYMHSSNLVINDQFTGAYTRDNLVTVECEVPVSEVSSGYHAEYAKDSVGWHSWHTGTVAGQIRKEKGIERQVFLSRWIKPVRIVPDSEVASMYKTLLDGTDIAVPDNVVTPSLRNELKKAGVKLQESGKVRYSITGENDAVENDAVENEKAIRKLENEIEDINSKLDLASVDGLSGTEVRRLRNQLTKSQYELDQRNAAERKAAVRTPLQSVLDNLDNYRIIDLESIANQLTDNAWDDVETLSTEELKTGIREIIQERAGDLSPLEMQSPKFGVYVRKPSTSAGVRYSITPEFEQWYKENFGGEDLTDAQLQRRLEYAKQKENDILVSKQAAKTKQDVDQRYKDLTAWMMYHERKMREQRQTLKDRSKAVQQSLKSDKKDALQKQAEIHKAELAVARDEKVKALKDQDLAWRIYSQQQTRNAAADKAEALKTARKEANAEKAEAVRTAKEVERARAEVQHDADMMAMKREAAKRLRVKEDAYQQKAEQRKENQKLKRNAAKQALRDSKLAAKKRAEAEVKQGAVDTIRKNPASRSAVEKLQERASQLRTLGRSAYRTFVNQALHIDELAKRQVEGTRASTLVTVLGGANDTVSTIYKNGLVDRAGNTIGESMKDVFLCWDIKGKKVDQNKQALLQDYMLHQHNVDRMSFVDRARTRLETFEQENPWLSQMDTKEFARLVAMTDAEIQSTGKQEAHDKAVQYARLLHEYDTAQNKPIFGDSDGNAVTADTSREIVQQYLAENPWLEEKAQGIYDWWDKFMRTWAVGDPITETEYNTMRELYPHYVPTYRADKKGVGAANFVGANGASIGKAVKKAKGGMSEVLNIEDSFSNLVSKIVRLERTNELYMNMIDSAMLDNDDTFSDMIVFDWDWQDGQYGKTLEVGAILNGDLDARYDDAETAGLSKVGQDRKLTAWHNGRQYSAYVSEDLFKSIANVTGTVANDLEKNLVKLGNTLTGPMKTAITGINPTFALRNVSRDLPTAITNSISGLAFPKYWAQAAAEIAKNSENWQHFQALGGTNATYYNDQNGFVKSMEQRDGIGAKAVSAMGAFNEVTEAQTRFAEYLATIDRLGDTYENRLLGIKNAAEVTVDFSRKGRAGKLINAWVPYWNPAVQGVDKVVRSVIDSPDGSAVWKQAAKTVGRASMTTVLFEAILYAVLKGMGRYDDWEELDDRTKDTYYCIPYGKSNTFIKVPKNREWGAILGTPLMRMLEYANGRENPFENYIETSLEPNFLPGQILAPREGGGFQSDVIGFSQALDLQANKDFAGRTIVPYAYQQGSITQQYDENTSWFAKKLGDLLNFSPMQIDYIIKDYFGDFGDLAVSATSDAVLKGTESLPEKATDLLTDSFKTDNRYSNYTVSKYYDTLEKLEQTVQDRKNQMEGDSYQDTVEYQTKSALDKLYGKQISELNKQVRNSTDQEERDNLKGQIADLAGQALEYYQDCMDGKVENPVLDAQYANLPSAVSKELERLDGYSTDYRFKPTGNPSAKYTDPKNKNKEYVLTAEQKDKFKDIYQEQYAQTFSKVIGSSKYKSASDEKKANLLENARDDVLEDTKDEFFKWLKKTGAKSTAKKK